MAGAGKKSKQTSSKLVSKVAFLRAKKQESTTVKQATHQHPKVQGESKKRTSAKKTLSKAKSVSSLCSKRLRLKEEPTEESIKVTIHDRRTTFTSNTPIVVDPTETLVDRYATLRSNIQQTLLSQFCIPLLSDRFVSNTARFSGVAFVIIGGFFVLVHMNTIQEKSFHFVSMPAEIISTSPLNYPSIANQEGIQSQPDVRLSVKAQDSLQGDVPVDIIVADALEVRVVAYSSESALTYFLGSAIKIDPSNWNLNWRTYSIPNGAYKLKIVVKNLFGSYERTDGGLYYIKNAVKEEAVLATSINPTSFNDDSDLGTSTLSESVRESLLTLQIAKTDSVEVPIYVKGANSRMVRVYARNNTSLSLYFVGRETTADDGIAKIIWKKNSVPRGEYTLIAKQEVDGKVIESDAVFYSVQYKETPTRDESVSDNEATTTLETPHIDTADSVKLGLSVERNKTAPYLVTFNLTGQELSNVEFYVQSVMSLTPKFVGKGMRKTEEVWQYTWDTRNTPNGKYNVLFRAMTPQGQREGERIPFEIQNVTVEIFTGEQEVILDKMMRTHDVLPKIVENIEEVPDESATQTQEFRYVEPVKHFIESLRSTQDVPHSEIEDSLMIFKHDLEEKRNALGRAIREDNIPELERVKASIDTTRDAFIQSLKDKVSDDEIAEKVSTYVNHVSFELVEQTRKNERIIKERIGDAVFIDSDNDEISDYDEVNLYKTNPFSADSDKDGFIDSTEISGGYDPLNSTPEAFIVYQSPKETGIKRDDILQISSITTLRKEEESSVSVPQAEQSPRAAISGRGLPNSFVTLYIYSTPIVATVRTDGDGNWTYILDKDLEEGDHEVYVGITDNAGNVIAKSDPLPFVKTAEAYTGGAAVAVLTEVNHEPVLLSKAALLLVAAIAVVALGLVLILLGIHIRPRRPVIMDSLSGSV
jgi:hypothetical protein